MAFPFSPDPNPAQRLPPPDASNRDPNTPQPSEVPSSGAMGGLGLFGQWVKNIQPPPPPGERFWSGFPDRSPSELGKDDWILEGARRFPGSMGPPYMPGPRDVGPLLNRSFGGLAQIGSPTIAHSAAWAARYNDAYQRAFEQEQEHQARMHDERYRQHMQETIDRQQAESQEYGVALETYKENPGKLDEEIRNVARRWGDTKITNILDGGGTMKEVEKLLQARDHFNLPLMKYRLEVENQRLAERRQTTAEKAETRLEKAQDAIDAARKEWLTPKAPEPSKEAPGVPPASASGLPKVSPRVEQAARERIMDRKGAGPRGADDIEDAIGNYTDAIQKRLDDIASDPNIKPEQVLPAVRAVHPELANDLQSYLDGKLTVPGGKAGAAGHFARIIGLADKIDPNITPETGKTRAATMRDFTSGNDGRNLSSIGTAFRHMRGLRSEFATGVPNIWDTLTGSSRYTAWAASAEGQEKIGRLDARVSTALTEYERALLGGKPTQTGRQAAEALADWRHRPLRVINQSLDVLEEQLRDRLQEQKDRFVAGTGGKPADLIPLFDRNIGATPEGREGSKGLHEMETPAASPAASIAAPPGAREGETLYFKGRAYRIQGDRAVPQ